MLTHCALCRKPLEKALINNFWYCADCELATREEACMQALPSGVCIEKWVRAEEKEKLTLARVKFTTEQVKKLRGVQFVLDVGCGGGMLVDRLNRNGYQADGVDLSEAVLEYAKYRKKGRFFLGRADGLEKIPFGRKYDLIVANHLIEHLRNPDRFLQQARRVLREGGYLYIETPNLKAWDPKSIWRHSIGGMDGPDHRLCYSFKSLSQVLENNGFTVQKVLTRTDPQWILDGTLNFFLHKFDTLFSRKRQGQQCQSSDNNVRRYEKRLVLSKSLKFFYRLFRNSFFLDIVLYIPSRRSERNRRGVQLVVISRRTEK